MNMLLPAVVAVILIFGAAKRVMVFDVFLDGAKGGLSTALQITPPLIALISAVKIMEASGLLDFLTRLISPLTSAIGFPAELFPMAIMRPISGSGSTALLTSIFESFSPDEFIGRAASVLSGSTETTLYTIAMYYGSVGISKSRHTFISAAAADVTAMLTAVLFTRLFFN